MFDQADVLEEDFSALAALMGFLPGVESQVTSKVGAPPKALPTLSALKGPLPAVHTLVLDEVGPHSERFPT